MAPKELKEQVLGEVPTTDPATLPGKTVEVNLSRFVPQTSKFYINLSFKITGTRDRNALTRFNGCSISKEQLYRIVRKRNQKVELVGYINTKDNWRLQLTTILALNRNTNTTILTQIRRIMRDFLEQTGSRTNLYDFIELVTKGIVQKELKKKASKVYPVRFSEIANIEVVKAPAS